MKKLLFGLIAALLFSTFARAQETPRIEIRPAPDVQPSSFQLTPVEGVDGTYRLKATRADAREVFQALAEKAGGKALFDNRLANRKFFISTRAFSFSTFQLGTPEKIIESWAKSLSLSVGRVGKDWVFLPRETVPTQLLIQPRQTPKNRGLDPDFNANPFFEPIDPKKLPPDAIPFEFNGRRVYRVPIRPGQK